MLLLTALVSLAASLPLQEPQPAAAPAPVRGLRLHEAGASDGFTLFTPLSSGSTFLIDMRGEVVHRWDTGLAPAAMAYLLDDGHLLRTIRVNENPRFFGGGLGGRILELDWEGAIVWDYTRSDDEHSLHHDLEVMPNGHVLAIQWEQVSRDEALALGRDPAATSPKGWWPDAILELERAGEHGAKVVWEWHAKDHLIQDFAQDKAGYGSPAEHPELIDVNADHRREPPLTEAQREERRKRESEMRSLGYTGGSDDAAKQVAPGEPEPDWMHTNSIDYDAGRDELVVNSPHLCEFFVLDHSTTSAEARGHTGGRHGRGGDLLYRWGNPRNYGAGGDGDKRLFYEHDVQWIAPGLPGAGHVLVFDNGKDRPEGKFSRVLELALPPDGARGFAREAGHAFGPAEPVWSYTAAERESFFSFFISGCQRLPNGNTLICSGAQGRFFEVTPEGRTVWEYWNPFGGEIAASFGNAAPRQPKLEPNAVFQATRIPANHPALRGRMLAAAASGK